MTTRKDDIDFAREQVTAWRETFNFWLARMMMDRAGADASAEWLPDAIDQVLSDIAHHADWGLDMAEHYASEIAGAGRGTLRAARYRRLLAGKSEKLRADIDALLAKLALLEAPTV